MDDDVNVGFVYVLTNPAFPGLVKIGETELLAEDRARKLFTTGVPAPFEVAFIAMTSRRKAVEGKAHQHLARYRPNWNREFFCVSADVAIRAVRLAMIDVAGIGSWQSTTCRQIKSGDRLALTLEAGQIFALISFSDMNSLLAGQPDIDLWQAHSNGDVLEVFGASSAGHVAGCATQDPEALSDPLPYLDRSKQVANGDLNGRERLLPGERLLWLPAPEQQQLHSAVLFEARNYVQITSRTWNLSLDENGYPLSLNTFTYDEPWPEAKRAICEALKLRAPKSWVPREERGDEWAPIGLDAKPPEYWLPQLTGSASKPRR